MDYNALASTDIDLLAFSDALRTELNADVLTFGQTLDAQATLPQIVSALASASDGQAASALEHIADRALPRTLLPSRAIDLGPRSSSIRVDAANPVKVNALSLLRAMLLLGNANRQVDLALASSLPGGSGINVALMIGEPPANSPLIAVTDTNDVIVRTAQVRLKIETRIATPLASVHVPVLAELGSASARITDIDCRPNSSAAVSLGVVTSPAMVAIGTVADADFKDMKRPLDPSPARVVKLPLVSVDAGAELILSDLGEKRVAFFAQRDRQRKGQDGVEHGAGRGRGEIAFGSNGAGRQCAGAGPQPEGADGRGRRDRGAGRAGARHRVVGPHGLVGCPCRAGRYADQRAALRQGPAGLIASAMAPFRMRRRANASLSNRKPPNPTL